MQRAFECFLAMSTTTRLSSSSPVSATTTSARTMPACMRTLGSQPSPTIATSVSSVFVMSCAFLASFSITTTSCCCLISPRARYVPTFPPPTMMMNIITVFLRRTRGAQGGALGSDRELGDRDDGEEFGRKADQRVGRNDDIHFVAIEQRL